MTDREIKFELAKMALTTGLSVEHITAFYDWIMKEPENKEIGKPTEWDNDPIEDLTCKLRTGVTINRRCKENGINTIGDLIRCGRYKFRKFRSVGVITITEIENALEKYFGITEWQ